MGKTTAHGRLGPLATHTPWHEQNLGCAPHPGDGSPQTWGSSPLHRSPHTPSPPSPPPARGFPPGREARNCPDSLMREKYVSSRVCTTCSPRSSTGLLTTPSATAFTSFHSPPPIYRSHPSTLTNSTLTPP